MLTRYVQRLTAKAAGATAAALVVAALSAVPGNVVMAQTGPAVVSAATDVQHLVATLNDAATDSKSRDEAALRLASRNSAEARQQLLAAINNAGNSKAQLAVARALANQAAPDASYVDPLFAAMGSDRTLSEAAGEALSRYKSTPAVTNRLLELAQNAQSHQNVRVASISALGSFTEKRVAKALVDLTGETSGSIRNAAADALVAMTDITENGRDAARWQRWWGTQAAKSDADFRDEWLLKRSDRLDGTTARIQQMANEMQAILTDVYRATTDAATKDALLIKWMSSGEPQVRLIAARFIVEDFQNGRTVGAPVKESLRALVGDSSPIVRLQATRSIGTLTDPGSFDALLTQLSQEPLPEVRAAIVTVLGSWEDPRAVQDISKLLGDESLAVAEASAEALAKLGPKLVGVERGAVLELSKTLRQTYDNRGNQPGAERLRENLVLAMAPLKDPDSLRLFMGLLKPRESDKMRENALKGITALGDPNAADVVRQLLTTETNPQVKVEALKALGASSKTEYLPTFFEFMTNEREQAAVRNEAWEQFKGRLDSADIAQLSKWDTQFKPYPERRIDVLKMLADRLLADKKLNDLAITRQNIGETLMQIKAPEDRVVTNATDAAVFFKLSLDYHRDAGSPENVTEKLIGQRLDALLAARKYAEAATFAGDLMAANRRHVPEAGRFRVEAERLRDLKKYTLALSLIEEATKIKALTGTHYLTQLKEVESEVNTLSKKGNEKNGTRGVPTEQQMAT